MKLGMLVLAGVIAAMGAPAYADDCSKTEMRGNSLKLARNAYSQVMNPYLESTVTVDQLIEARQKERTCKGQGSLNYLIMLMQVQRGDLQTSVQNMEVLLQTDAEPVDKQRMMSRLIDRLVAANDIRAAIHYNRRAIEEFPDASGSYSNNLILLLAGTRQFEEARAIADARLEAALRENTRQDRIPYAGWLRLAVSEVSGDAADRQLVVARLSDHFGDQTEALIVRDAPFSDFVTLFHGRFGKDARVGPLKPPTPNYPQRMAELGRSGLCEVRFDVGFDGVPENITSECTDEGFAEESERAVSKVRFAHPVLNGVPRRIYDVVYPLEYNIY